MSFTAPGFYLLADHLQWESILERQFFALLLAEDKLRRILAIRRLGIDMRSRMY